MKSIKKYSYRLIFILLSIYLLTSCSSQKEQLHEKIQGEWDCDAGRIIFTADKMFIDELVEVEYEVIDGQHIRWIGSMAAGEFTEVEVMFSGDQMILINISRPSLSSQNCIRTN